MPLSVSVIIATYQRPKQLERQLKALSRQSLLFHEFEVIVVEDGPVSMADEALKYWRHHLPNLTYVSQKQKGPAAARNFGARISSGPIIAFTDDDCVADSHWLERLITPFQHVEVLAVQGLTYTHQGSRTPLTHQIENLTGHPAVPTCNAAYRKEIFNKVGGFDESFPHPHNEDADLAWRVKEFGTIHFEKEAKMYHPPRPDGLRKNLNRFQLLRSEFRLWWKAPHRYRKHRGRSPWSVIYGQVFFGHQFRLLKHHLGYWKHPKYLAVGLLISVVGWFRLIALLPAFVLEDFRQAKLVNTGWEARS